MTDALERRIARLEAIEAIKNLKARYWQACDRKDVAGVIACFADGPVEIDYDGPAGKLVHRDGLRDVFASIATKAEIVEVHHGGAPSIEIVDDDHATGRWGLVYHLMDTKKGLVNHVGGYYDDAYVRVDGAWAIRVAVFRVCSAYVTRWKDGEIKLLHAGATLPSS